MQNDWLNVGKQKVEELGGQDAILHAISGLEWIDVTQNPKISLPFSQGYALRELIKSFRLDPQKLAYHTTTGQRLDGHALLAVETKYGNGDTAKIYVLDDGMSVTPVLSVHQPLNG